MLSSLAPGGILVTGKQEPLPTVAPLAPLKEGGVTQLPVAVAETSVEPADAQAPPSAVATIT